MSHYNRPDPPEETEERSVSFAHVKQKQRYFSGVWILPIVAALIAGYLGMRSYMEHGPDVTISFKSAQGLSVGQTQIKYKSVTLGTVQRVELKSDLSGVVVHAAMTADADRFLTNHAHFWVVRPQLNASNISDIQLLVSGTYIQLEPGEAGGSARTDFEGLEKPPDVRSEEPGRVYVLRAQKLGSISIGSPVYYRDIDVGQVLAYDIGDGFGDITITIFVRDPFAQYVRENTHFWNASGLNVKLSGGLHLELQSLQSVIAGGISFSTPASDAQAPEAEAKSVFALFESKQLAEMADGDQFNCVSYFQTAVKDVGPGSPVEIYGVRVGQVTNVKLIFDAAQNQSRIRVGFAVKPALAFGDAAGSSDNVTRIMHQLLQKGMRAVLSSSDLVGGQEILSLEFAPRAGNADFAMEENSLLVPGYAGGSVTDALSDVAKKLDQIPFDQIGGHLDHLLAAADEMFGGPEMKQAVHDLADTMGHVQKVSQQADTNLTPALQRLPEISNHLQDTLKHADQFMASVNTGYGADSDFQRSLKRTMDEINDAARSIHLLADYIDRHPEALLKGKSAGPENVKKEEKP